MKKRLIKNQHIGCTKYTEYEIFPRKVENPEFKYALSLRERNNINIE
jgi:hypothetical protein